jgi:delta14-sterol reductase/lamin-B receptor
MVALPLVIVWLLLCSVDGLLLLPAAFLAAAKSTVFPYLLDPRSLLPSTTSLIKYFAMTLLLALVLPGPVVNGTGIPTPQSPSTKFHLPYLINGHLQFWITTFLLPFIAPSVNTDPLLISFSSPLSDLAGLYADMMPLALATILLSLLLSVYLYAASFAPKAHLAEGGNSGNHVYDFFIGRELNPRVRTFLGVVDLKEFCELRPGLIGWAILNAGNAAEQYSRTGTISGSMLLANLFQLLYVWDALYHEAAILTTMDITTDGFGFMLAFGDLAWVPFTYSLQTRYLVNNDPGLSGPVLLCIAVLNLVGYNIFRGANSQKDQFRRDPTHESVKDLKFLNTKRGTKLLTSGYWGIARKANYTGDWLMGLSWCLLCGTGSIVPYFYCIYFGILLVHRSIRDDAMCQVKYGDDWDTYKGIVRWRFIPGLF